MLLEVKTFKFSPNFHILEPNSPVKAVRAEIHFELYLKTKMDDRLSNIIQKLSSTPFCL